MMGFTPVMLSPVLTFAVFIAVTKYRGVSLDTARIFVPVSFLTLLSQPLSDLFQSAPMIMSMVGCFGRIETFMQTDQRVDPRELEGSSVLQVSTHIVEQPYSSPMGESCAGDGVSEEKAITGQLAVEIIDGAFGWKKNSDSLRSILKNVNLQIPRGSLTLIVGPVGCGKSTLLKIMLGEVPSVTGTLKVSSQKIAYCDQTPWIMNGTLKETSQCLPILAHSIILRLELVFSRVISCSFRAATVPTWGVKASR
ncbi:hypothetical protein K458DRAFT_384833 [Lentithecium fluviatile CBS 122367]|uniref:ABC transporter domain-containing protein n=1 Tax=Lentithecium fluviatile CBS 122367 TaxID=1168545 RepID=A0A6G1JDN3_9PLEO|nr:hypothetical protein K458DRAFT_384833 [Lentithecium fluviatile CBS 122367]